MWLYRNFSWGIGIMGPMTSWHGIGFCKVSSTQLVICWQQTDNVRHPFKSTMNCKIKDKAIWLLSCTENSINSKSAHSSNIKIQKSRLCTSKCRRSFDSFMGWYISKGTPMRIPTSNTQQRSKNKSKTHNMMSNTINICFVFDEKFVDLFKVSILSIAQKHRFKTFSIHNWLRNF